MQLMHAGSRVTRFGALGLLAVVLFVLGCSSGGQNDRSASYEEEMRGVVAELAEPLAKGFGFVDVDSDRDAAQLAKEMAGDFRRTQTRAESVQAPNDVADEHAAFIAALGRVADNFEVFAESGGKDTAALDRTNVESVNSPLSAIQKKGYDLNWK